MPSGTAASDSPVTPRPMISGTRLWLRAQMSEPTVRKPAHTMSISRLPYRSPSRPTIGTATAAASKVEVSSHSVLVVELCRSSATCGSTGMRTDMVSDTIRPAVATTASAAIWLGSQPPVSASRGRISPDVPAGGRRWRFLDHGCLPASCGTAHMRDAVT